MAKSDGIVTHTLYGGEIVITFEENPWHTYKLNGIGQRLISATKVTGQLDKSGPLMYWAVNLMKEYLYNFLDHADDKILNDEMLRLIIEEASKQHAHKKKEAGTIGDLVHDFAEAHSLWKSGLGEQPSVKDLPKEAMKGVNGYLDWIAGKKVEEDRVERVIYSKQHGWVGKTDRTAVIDGKRTVLDYKTANGLYLEYLLQLALYWIAVEEEDGVEYDQGLVIRFDKETGEFHEHIISRELFVILCPIAIKLYEVCNLLRNPNLDNFLKSANPKKK